MSLYNKDKVKELAEEQLKKDLLSRGDLPNDNPCWTTLTHQEFYKFFTLFQASKYTVSTDIFKEWKFYVSDDILDEIICAEDDLLNAYSEIYDMEEALEDAKERRLIYGFVKLSDELWIINDGGR